MSNKNIQKHKIKNIKIKENFKNKKVARKNKIKRWRKRRKKLGKERNLAAKFCKKKL